MDIEYKNSVNQDIAKNLDSLRYLPVSRLIPVYNRLKKSRKPAEIRKANLVKLIIEEKQSNQLNALRTTKIT